MGQVTRYQGVEPPKKWLETQVTRLCFYFFGIGIETAYRYDPKIRAEMNRLPDPFSFCMSVANGPSMMVVKRGESVEYVGEREAYRADLELQLKHIEFAYLAMTGRMSTPDLVYHNRQLIRGDLNYMMVMVRVMNAAQSLLFPNLLLRFYVKQVPRLTFQTVINRCRAYGKAFIGFYV
jgi:hypothetical protein